MPLIPRAQRYLTLMNLWAPRVVIPLPHYNKKWIILMSSSVFPNSTMKNWKKTDAIFGVVEKGLVLIVLLQILGEDGAHLWLLFGSLIGVSSVHSCPNCSVRHIRFSNISHTPRITPVNCIHSIDLIWLFGYQLFQICRTSVSLWDLFLYFWIVNFLSDSFPWIPILPMSKT